MVASQALRGIAFPSPTIPYSTSGEPVTKNRSTHIFVALGVVVAAVILGVAVARPAGALPGYSPTCNTSGCHVATPVGSVSAIPSKTTLAPGESYSVAVTVSLSSGGQAGFHISSAVAGTPAVNVTGGPGTSPFSASMTAPNAAGTYTYKVFGAKGRPSASGQSTSTTYQITVSGGGGVTDTVAPTPVAPSAASVTRGKIATLKYQVKDPLPNLGTANVTIKIKNAAGKVVKTIKKSAVPVNTLKKATFTCKLAKGKYRFFVTAVDAAGNASTVKASNRLTVK
jgi:hypothetical protein